MDIHSETFQNLKNRKIKRWDDIASRSLLNQIGNFKWQNRKTIYLAGEVKIGI